MHTPVILHGIVSTLMKVFLGCRNGCCNDQRAVCFGRGMEGNRYREDTSAVRTLYCSLQLHGHFHTP